MSADAWTWHAIALAERERAARREAQRPRLHAHAPHAGVAAARPATVDTIVLDLCATADAAMPEGHRLG
jgi:hypothetical protein